MEIEREIIRVGNSAGVLLPRAWLHGKARITLVKKPLYIKKDVFEILIPYFEDIIGIYLAGSYARGEQTARSDIDILAISQNTKKTLFSGKYEIEIVPLRNVLSLLRKYPMMIFPKLVDAKVILNRGLLEELRQMKPARDSLKAFISDTKRIIKIGRKFLQGDALEGNILRSVVVVYSSVLRLRALYMMGCIFKNRKYSNTDFREWMISKLNISVEDLEKIYEIYKDVRDKKKVKQKIPLILAEKLLGLLEKEIERYGKKKKKT